MDLDDLGPAEEEILPEPIQPRSESPFRSSVRKTEKEKKGRKSALKSTSGSSLNDKDRDVSPFKASSDREKSPFKASVDTDESPFKASSKGKGKSVLKETAGKKDSPFNAGSSRDKSPFKASASASPFKANNKENDSPFRARSDINDSPFKAKGKESSPFKSKNEGSFFKATDKNSSPFKAKSSKQEKDSDRSASKATPRKSKKTKERKEKSSKSKKKDTSDIFSSFGIQTVEDLLGSSVKVSEYECIASDAEDRSDVSEEIRTEKPGAYSYSQRFEDSVTEIVTEVNGTKASGPSYTEDFDSISERIGGDSDVGQSSASEVRTKYSGEETAVDYTEFSESDTETIASSSTYSDDEDRTYSDSRRDDNSYPTYSEDFTRSLMPTSRSDLTPILPRGMTTSGVQTTSDGLRYSWDALGSGLSFPGMPYGLGFVDPTPIATHVVSADALEAMTAYSPAMLALHDMLKSQLELTQEFLMSQKRMYQEFSSNIESSFHYTTLEDTKKYIKKNKKKKLSFKEALKMVDQEMTR